MLKPHQVYALLQSAFGMAGLHVTRAANTLARKRLALLRQAKATVVLDVGANTGQYAAELRRHGFDGRIVSFEPLSAPYQVLSRMAGSDPRHECLRVALGNSDQAQVMQVSGNVVSSSLFQITDEAVAACPESTAVGAETVRVARLDTIRDEVLRADDRVYLKIDTQGYEREVLLGALHTLPRVQAVEVELSLAPLYAGQPLLPELWSLLHEQGFRPVWLERGFTDPRTGFMLQVDGLFARPGDPG